MSDLSITVPTPASIDTNPDVSVPDGTIAPLQICMLGGRSAGKTCFLGGLAILDRRCGWHLRADSRSTTRIDDIVTMLTERGGWLPPTRQVDYYHMTLSFKGNKISFSTYDYPGVYVQTAFRTLNHEAAPHLLQHFVNSDCILVVLDPDEDLMDAPVLAAIDDSLKHRFLGARGQRPGLAIVLTKADRYGLQNSNQAAAFLRKRCPSFLAKVRTLAGKVTTFPVSAVGVVDENGRPTSDSQPTGYEALFRWLAAFERARKRRPWRRWALLAGFALLGGFAVARAADVSDFFTHRNLLREPKLSAADKLDRTRTYDGWFSGLIDSDRTRIARDELNRLRISLQSAHDELSTRQVMKEIHLTILHSPLEAREEGLTLKQSAVDQAAKMARDQIEQLRSSSNRGWIESAQLFLDHYPDTSHAEAIRGWLIADLAPAQRDGRTAVARIDIDSPTSCRIKAEAIRRYLAEHGAKFPPAERRRIERAAELGELLGRKRDWPISILNAGEFKQARRMSVRLCYPDNQFVGADSASLVQRLNDTEDPISLDWWPGLQLRVQIWTESGWPTKHEALAASTTLNGPLALLDLVGDDTGLALVSECHWHNSFTGLPTTRLRIRGIDTEDVRIAKEYLAPGLRWK